MSVPSTREPVKIPVSQVARGLNWVGAWVVKKLPCRSGARSTPFPAFATNTTSKDPTGDLCAKRLRERSTANRVYLAG
jgi:hypothetical protein